MGTASTIGNNGKNNSSVKKSIGKTLLMCLLPVIIIGVVAIILILSFNAKATIEDVSLMDLQAETQTNAYNIGTGFRMLLAKFGQYCDTMEQVPFEDEEAILKYIEPSTNYTIINNTGIYIGFEDDTYIFANHTIQAPDWKPTQRDWYKLAQGHETFIESDPYVDSSTGQLCVSFVRQNSFYNGMEGVCAVDVFLGDIQNEASKYTPMKTGNSMILAGD